MILTEGHNYLGCAISRGKFFDFLDLKNWDGWISELESLSHIAETQSHCAFAAFTHSFIPKWNYMMRVIDCSQDEFKGVFPNAGAKSERNFFCRNCLVYYHQETLKDLCWSFRQDWVIWTSSIPKKTPLKNSKTSRDFLRFLLRILPSDFDLDRVGNRRKRVSTKIQK